MNNKEQKDMYDKDYYFCHCVLLVLINISVLILDVKSFFLILY